MDTKEEFDSKPVYNKTILKILPKIYDDEVIEFQDKELILA